MSHRDYDLVEHGFTILRRVHDPATVASAHTLLTRIIRHAERELQDPFEAYFLPHRPDQGALYDVLQRHPDFWHLASAPAVLDQLELALGPDIQMYENSVVYKPAGKRNGVPYHQDFISRPDEPRKFIAWTALEPVTREKGAMRVLPGSHKSGFLPWVRVKGETHHDRIDPAHLPATEPVYTELEAGDVLIFDQLLVHGSDEVSGEQPRIAFRVSYQGFDRISVPRGCPIVLRGGTPESLGERFPSKRSSPRTLALWRRGLRYIGRYLARF